MHHEHQGFREGLSCSSSVLILETDTNDPAPRLAWDVCNCVLIHVRELVAHVFDLFDVVERMSHAEREHATLIDVVSMSGCKKRSDALHLRQLSDEFQPACRFQDREKSRHHHQIPQSLHHHHLLQEL